MGTPCLAARVSTACFNFLMSLKVPSDLLMDFALCRMALIKSSETSFGPIMVVVVISTRDYSHEYKFIESSIQIERSSLLLSSRLRSTTVSKRMIS